MAYKPKNRNGNKYGFITITSDTGKRTKQGNIIYNCVCECGTTFERSFDSITNSLKHNCIISCGCKLVDIHREQGKKSNISNNPYQQEQQKKALKQYDGTCIIQLKRKKINKNSSTGVRGVSYTSSKEKKYKYRVRLTLRRKEYFLGYAETLEEALALRKRGEERLYNPVIEEYKEVQNEN